VGQFEFSDIMSPMKFHPRTEAIKEPGQYVFRTSTSGPNIPFVVTRESDGKLYLKMELFDPYLWFSESAEWSGPLQQSR